MAEIKKQIVLYIISFIYKITLGGQSIYYYKNFNGSTNSYLEIPRTYTATVVI